MFLSSIVTRGYRSFSSIVNCFQDQTVHKIGIAIETIGGLGCCIGGILKFKSSSQLFLGGRLFGSGFVLLVQSSAQGVWIRDHPNFRLTCKRIGYLALAALTNGVAWGMVANTPLEEQDFGDVVFLGLSFIASEVLANGADLEKSCWSACSETLTNSDISQTETDLFYERLLEEHS